MSMTTDVTEAHDKSFKLKDEDGEEMCITDVDYLNNDECIGIHLKQGFFTIEGAEAIRANIKAGIEAYKAAQS